MGGPARQAKVVKSSARTASVAPPTSAAPPSTQQLLPSPARHARAPASGSGRSGSRSHRFVSGSKTSTTAVLRPHWASRPRYRASAPPGSATAPRPGASTPPATSTRPSGRAQVAAAKRGVRMDGSTYVVSDGACTAKTKSLRPQRSRPPSPPTPRPPTKMKDGSSPACAAARRAVATACRWPDDAAARAKASANWQRPTTRAPSTRSTRANAPQLVLRCRRCTRGIVASARGSTIAEAMATPGGAGGCARVGVCRGLGR
mmetsp:Transcript_2750/g.8657  ORF Transcript_2750/g.8657 Transcript_2750/m.8657 type:complete len:260 (+) Transcript_2750:154-933(+)